MVKGTRSWLAAAFDVADCAGGVDDVEIPHIVAFSGSDFT